MKFQPSRPSSDGFLVKQLRKIIPLCIAGIFILLYRNAVTGGSAESAPSVVGKFPRKIWQSWKVGPLSFELRDSDRAKTWTVKNPGYRYEVLTDDNAMHYVEDHFGPLGLNRPDIVHTYKSLNDPIIKSDLLRYLIMYAEGGVYADIDVEALKPLELFIPDRFDERDIDMVIGVETDEPSFLGHPVLGSKSQSFCQWTFICKPRLPVMMRLIDGILAWLNEMAKKQGKTISELELDFDEVISGTGPSAFTQAILAEISKLRGEDTTWEHFHSMLESKVVGRVLVLTVEAFAAGTGHSDSGNHGGKSALIKHHFHASSWPTSHPRYKHPVYGEVEKCNWNPECVKLWDANTKFFDSLPAQEQVKLIAMKELEDANAPKPEEEAPFGQGGAKQPDGAVPIQAPFVDEPEGWYQGGPDDFEDDLQEDFRMPAAQPVAKPEVKADIKPDAKPETKPEAKPDSKPQDKNVDGKPDAKLEVKDSKVEPKPDAKAEPKPEPKPEVNGEGKAGAVWG
ncbi:hypothetical protein A1O3_06036 [Capronia epimyces CBS 606.96]|uniref:Uncharacterized protein n=1 Tax=Capronia epimyces CBS 606.96 TaxID=1182542 RepID=W9XPS2_9EURO|nr:uncharacterized protein A1O3_06036 [Capronia epimyces CBS 606.96]EXJ82223.1 hypothetical protein A1O3_06036 [Capronia epimyces CBS 606.96]